MTHADKHRAWWAGWRMAGALAVGAVLVWLASRGLPDGRLHVYFLDVGQGDAIFVLTPDGRQILVDGGPSPAALLAELGRVMPFWDRTLDLAVLTHPDADHQAGLLAVLERYQVTQVLDSADAHVGRDASIWQDLIAHAGATHACARRGARVSAGEVVFTVLHPGPLPLAGTSAGDNNNSLVLRLDYGQTAFLLAGDAEQEAEAALLAAGVPLRANVLKVGHHGSGRSTSAPFVAAVAPRLAVVQVGAENRFGHPQPATLARLAGASVLRTDRDGLIEIAGDGQRLWIKLWGE